MVSATHADRQRSPVPTGRGPLPAAAAGAVEIRLPLGDPDAGRTLCRIFILPPGATAAEPLADRPRAASRTHDDEEPTWEDAQWQ